MRSQLSCCGRVRRFISKQVLTPSGVRPSALGMGRGGQGAPTKQGPAPQHFLQGRQELPPPSTPQSDPRTNRYSGLAWEGLGGKPLLIPTSTLTATVEELMAQQCGPNPACSPSRTFSSMKTPVSWGTHGQQGPGPEA